MAAGYGGKGAARRGIKRLLKSKVPLVVGCCDARFEAWCCLFFKKGHHQKCCDPPSCSHADFPRHLHFHYSTIRKLYTTLATNQVIMHSISLSMLRKPRGAASMACHATLGLLGLYTRVGRAAVTVFQLQLGSLQSKPAWHASM